MKTLMIIVEKIGAYILWLPILLALPIGGIRGLRSLPRYLRARNM